MSDIAKGFREFVLRGNVIDLAVGFVIGLAFVALIANFNDSFIQPIIRIDPRRRRSRRAGAPARQPTTSTSAASSPR